MGRACNLGNWAKKYQQGLGLGQRVVCKRMLLVWGADYGEEKGSPAFLEGGSLGWGGRGLSAQQGGPRAWSGRRADGRERRARSSPQLYPLLGRFAAEEGGRGKRRRRWRSEGLWQRL